ncbi:MAG TPA: hypothetical protein DCQ31_05570 [Bacteroidales bacterium]|nr:hypothetical protein [Bacteroidales bacterium]
MQVYSAILIHPNISGGRCSGNLQIKPEGVIFNSEEINYNINFKNLSIYAGGAGNRFIFFKDKTTEDISVYTSDKSVLKDQLITSSPYLSQDLKQSKKNLNKLLISSLVVLSVIVLFIVGLFLVKDTLVKSLAKQVPVEWEQNVGEKLFSTMSAEYNFIKNDSLKNEFLTVGAPLFSQMENQGFKIDLYFVKDQTINAFALPGGKIIVHTGLIENAKSWEEVMGVLGHEMAHVSLRHHVRGIINNLGIYVILSAIVGDVSALAGSFINMGGSLATLSNSRAFEHEADEAAWNYLITAKINPNGLISFFEILKNENESGIDSTVTETFDLSFLSTHPDTQNRIDKLKQKQEKLNQKFDALPENFNAFKEALLKID